MLDHPKNPKMKYEDFIPVDQLDTWKPSFRVLHGPTGYKLQSAGCFEIGWGIERFDMETYDGGWGVSRKNPTFFGKLDISASHIPPCFMYLWVRM